MLKKENKFKQNKHLQQSKQFSQSWLIRKRQEITVEQSFYYYTDNVFNNQTQLSEKLLMESFFNVQPVIVISILVMYNKRFNL